MRYKKNQTEIQEVKLSISEMKGTLNGKDVRVHSLEED
jgi:hypothetical protein